MNCMDLRAGTNDVIKRKVSAPTVLHPMKVLTSPNGVRTLTAVLCNYYIQHYDVSIQRSTIPVVVFTTRASHAALLLSFLRTVAKERFGESAADRIKGVWAGIQGDEWVSRFLAQPNTTVDETDVLITTSVLQAGHSLDRYFRLSFDFLFRGVLSFREELQLTSRLRYLGREDMAENKFCWIPAGGPDSRRAGKRQLRLDVEQAFGRDAETNWGPDFVNTMRSIYIPLKSELSDTFNRHYWLHKTEYRLSQIRLVQVDEDDLLAEHDPGFQGITLTGSYEHNVCGAAGPVLRGKLDNQTYIQS
ncbi:hypothetical protein V1527DRAFT_267878 [Lipomyces starkeyi]